MTEIANPDNATHRATIKPLAKPVLVSRDGVELAKSNDAIIVSEQSARGVYPPVIYIPLSDVSTALTPIEDKTTHCPLKGDASYFAYNGAEVAWNYDLPLPSSAVLKNYVAFYGDRVEIEEG